jgi:hypothetical protein
MYIIVTIYNGYILKPENALDRSFPLYTLGLALQSHLSNLGLLKVDSTRCQRLGIATLIWIITAIPMIQAEGITAIPADLFVESIGVNTHWAYSNVYTHSYTELKVKLGECGIRYVRDGANQQTYTRANDLYQSLGIKTNMLTGRRKSGSWPQPLDPSQVEAELNEIKTQALNATVSLEAPNEYDASHGDPETDWVGKIKNYSQTLYTLAKADEALKNLPVIGPSFTRVESYEAVGDSDQYIDSVNLHLYQANRWPGNNGWGDHGYGSITWALAWLAWYQSPSGKPVQSTEGGYNNDLPSGGVSEEAEGKYTARMFAEYFRRGFVRTYKYELVSEGQAGREGVFGLLRNDITEKPAFRAVKNLITILSDKGPTFTPSSLNYALDDNVNNVRQILFQKRNGDFYLMVWLELPSWDVNANKDLYPPAQEVLLTLLYNHNISNVTLYAFNNTADVNTSMLPINENQVTLSVTDKISIIKLSKNSNSIRDVVY